MDSEAGTGFVIDGSGYVLTASHVIPDSRYKALIIGGSFGPETAGPQVYQLKLVRRSNKLDAALLQIVHAPPDLTILPLRSAPARPGEKLFTFGYPLALPQTHLVDGVVSATDNSAVTSNTLIDGGFSGGPMVDTQGCVISIAYENLNSAGGEPVNGIKFGVPVISLADLLPLTLSRSSSASAAALAASTIHVSDVLTRMQTDHDDFLNSTVRWYDDVIKARPGYTLRRLRE